MTRSHLDRKGWLKQPFQDNAPNPGNPGIEQPGQVGPLGVGSVKMAFSHPTHANATGNASR